MAYETAAQIISDAAVELGLITADIADPFASSDQSILQLCRLLTSVGRELRDERAWSHLVKEHTFATVATDNDYALPADFVAMLPQTYWNRGTDHPGTPMSGQTWQYFQAHSSSPAMTALFRVVEGEIRIFPTPTSVETIAFEYQSSYWVKESGESSPNTDRVDAAADTLHFDALLLVRRLKLAWLRAKGFDSTAAQLDADKRMSQVSDGPAPVLSIGGPSGERFIDGRNLPDTGWGS